MRAPWTVLILANILVLILGDHVCHLNVTDFGVPGHTSTELTVSILQPVQIRLPSNWNLDFEFDVIWPLPPQENFRKKYFKKRPWMVKRRHRREFYANIEAALNSRNLPGRQCILRSICEAKTLLSPPGTSFVEDAIRLILSNIENVDQMDSYDIAYRTEAPCDVTYACPFSFLKLLLFDVYPDDLG